MSSDMPRIVIERPRGSKKIFNTSRGRVEQTFPLDYGFFDGVINPDDNMEADVFVGSGGPHYGRFAKGKRGPSGEWIFDERKWYVALTDEEYQSLHAWWHEADDPGLTWDWIVLSGMTGVLADLRGN